MRLEHDSAEKIRTQIRDVLAKRLDLSRHRVFFFGSRVSGKGSERSDIDVGVEGLEKVPSPVWLEIQEAIENLPTLYTIQMVDFKTVSPEFREVALQHTEPL